MAWAAVDEEPDNPLGAAEAVRLPGSHGIGPDARGPQSLVKEQGIECQHANATACALQQLAAGEGALDTSAVVVVGHSM